MRKRTIAVFTGNRAEYGLQFPILRAIAAHPDLDYRLIVSGAHLDPQFGRTLAEIESDGFRIDAEVKIDMGPDAAISTARAIGTGVVSMAEALARLAPDALLVYADRFEGFAAVIAGTQSNIPTAHVEGGDLTEGGALDDSVRHAMSKLAHLHFTTNIQATNRILAMGEEPWRVHTVGFPAIDLIAAGQFAPPEAAIEKLGLDPKRPVVLFTQHSVTTQFDAASAQLAPALDAIERLAAEGVQTILTYPNNDVGGRALVAGLERFAARAVPGTIVRRSLGRWLYHGVLALSRVPGWRVACVGNSSSGIKETPAFGCPTVNIGSRQQGRLRAGNVIDAPYDAAALETAIRRCLFDDAFRAACARADNPYGVGDAGPKIAKVLAEADLGPSILRKGMTLRGEARDGWFR
jgi:UDP-N-acetylglucosamine 2-epimerase (non-hydrolysing)/GDP/UDP-N,N'-diacetylbacillosamine 2-epimerase (hydrolysing)